MSSLRATNPGKREAVVPDEGSTFHKDRLRALALPLGGIGTGSVALAGDGGLRQWQISNNVNHDAHVPHSFFAILASERRSARRNAVVLQTNALYDDEQFRPAPSISDHLIPDNSRRLLDELPGVDSIAVTAQYPIVEVDYHSQAIPVQVRLQAFNPFIPLNSKDSGLPVVLFSFVVRNPSDKAVDVSLLAAQQNLVGWDGKTFIDGVRNPGYGGNVNAVAHLQDVTALNMNSVALPADHPANGQLSLAVLTEPGDETTTLLRWEKPRQVWDHFVNHHGRLPTLAEFPATSGPSPAGQTWNGALAVHFTLEARSQRVVTFMLAWHFPNRYVTWDQSRMGVRDRKSRFWLGNQYSNWFGSALSVIEYVRDHYRRLVEQTHLFRECFFQSTLPEQLLQSVAGPISTIRAPTCLWLEDGSFHGFEGCHGASTTHGALEGCCPMNCTHVWNYEMALAKLFPDLERSMRHTDLKVQISPTGSIPHRTVLPLYLARPWHDAVGGPRKPALDGELGTVLKTYRELRHGAGMEWFNEMWPRVKQLLEHVMRDHDTQGDGVIRGEQPNTYDISFYGPNPFIGSLYLAALRAGEEMAKLQSEAALAQRYRKRYELGRQNYDKLCWNGEYYVQVVDQEQHPEHQFGTGCHIDQLPGQWWAHLLDLGYVLPEPHVKMAVKNIFKYNRRETFRADEQNPRVFMDERDKGLYNCTWPHGGKPLAPTLYSDEVWTGLEYVLACLLLYEGETESALTVLADIRERHDGSRRSPWNEIECGDHYVRAMSSWALLEAASGYVFDATNNSLTFSPRISHNDFYIFFITADAWGSLSQNATEAQLSVAYGSLKLGTLQLKANAASATLSLGQRALDVSVARTNHHLQLSFPEPVAIASGEVLTVHFMPD